MNILENTFIIKAMAMIALMLAGSVMILATKHLNNREEMAVGITVGTFVLAFFICLSTL